MKTEIWTIEGGQKDALLKRANIKKKVYFKLIIECIKVSKYNK